jgi:flagellar motor switch/type III secretory pathway protein FliN
VTVTPNFSAYPFARVPRVSRERARIESVVARWLAARGQGKRLATLVGGPVRARVVPGDFDPHGTAFDPHNAAFDRPGAAFDPYAATCIVKAHGASIECRGSSLAVRRIAQRLLGGPDELPAPRPLSVAEESIWSLVVATALEDLGVEGVVWPRLVGVGVGVSPGVRGAPTGATSSRVASTIAGSSSSAPARGAADGATTGAGSPAPTPARTPTTFALDVMLGDIPLVVELRVPATLPMRAPPPGAIPVWADRATLDVPIIVGRCALPRTALDRLAVRTLITLEAPPTGVELEILGGILGLRAAAKALVAEVVTDYLPRDMTLPDAAHVELTVALGTTQLSLRQVFELSIGQIVPLGRPLAGPFELRAAGRVVGKGELVDVDGELAVRIVSLGDQE